MSITRRKALGFIPAISAALIPAFRTEAKPTVSSRLVLGYELHDDESLALLERYARSLALRDKKARLEAQKLFHKAEKLMLDNVHVTGYGFRLRWKALVEAYESGNKPPAFCRNRR